MKLPGLRREREARLWSIMDLARATGLTWETAHQADQGKDVSMATAKKILLALEASPVTPTARELLRSSSWTPGNGQIETIGPHEYLPGQGAMCVVCMHNGRVGGDTRDSAIPLGFKDDPIHER